MSPAELRQALRAQRKELRKRLPELRKAARERAAKLPVVQQAKRRRRIVRTLTAIIIALLLLLIRCDCGPGAPPPPPEAKAVEKAPAPKGVAKVKVAPKKPLEGSGTKQQRGNLGIGPPPAPTWIDEFQLQVAARSPRLAKCFTGIDRPGALRWSTAVNPQSGAVTDHELEPVGASDELRGDQKECVRKVLSNPPYKLTAPEKEGLPNRVSLVIEF